MSVSFLFNWRQYGCSVYRTISVYHSYSMDNLYYPKSYLDLIQFVILTDGEHIVVKIEYLVLSLFSVM